MVEKAFWKIALLYQMKLLIMWVNACRNTKIDQNGNKRSGFMVFPVSRN